MSTSNPTLSTTSAAQFAANRANAQLSCGPKSAEGKAISSRNHTTHGLTAMHADGNFKVLPGEDQAEYDSCLAAFMAEWQPVTPTELDLVESMVTHRWLRVRARRLQEEKIEQGMNGMEDYRQFDVLIRYHNTHHRAFNKAFSDLMRLRSFQMRQKKEEALLQQRAQQIQIRFESQKQKAELNAAKIEALRLKNEAKSQRNHSPKVRATVPPVVETALSESA